MTKTVYFDLFFTLIIPAYPKENSEFDLLNLSAAEWEQYAEKDLLYRERALGFVRSGMEIVDKITALMPFQVSAGQKEKILRAREERMKNALQTVPEEIVDVLRKLKSMGIKLGLISNADCIDCKYWRKSALYPYFDDAVFSCAVGLLKPDRQIYELAMRRLNAFPEQCLFVGDGGSNELCGAKAAGMKTVFSEVLERKSMEQRAEILKYADRHIERIGELLDCL